MQGSEKIQSDFSSLNNLDISRSKGRTISLISFNTITTSSSVSSNIRNKKAAYVGGKIAGDARKQLEIKSGKKVISEQNYLSNSQKIN